MDELKKFIPKHSYPLIIKLIENEELLLKITRKRKTKHGDYMNLPNGGHRITISYEANNYQFLITLVHEIAHLQTYKKYGRAAQIKPHGIEWKTNFRNLMLPFLNEAIFPDDLLRVLALHMKNPKASSSSDGTLFRVLRKYDEEQSDKIYLSDLKINSVFSLNEKSIFKMLKKNKTTAICERISNKKLYRIKLHAQVKLINE